mmetsp:Transcript_14389/g.26492  ORF Transcript_14389/g.26492 Transcript_14389/m.26492 type:complete len:227 (+) Transcript_14389:66-746(+)
MAVVAEGWTMTVASLSGATASLQCDSSDTHCDISKKAAASLSLKAPYGLHLLCAGRLLSEHAQASEVFEAATFKDSEVQVLVKSVTEWLADHEFVYHYKNKQDSRCGQPYFVSHQEMEGVLRFFTNGTFEFEWVELIRVEDTASHSRSAHDQTIATGKWSLCSDKQSVALMGRAEVVSTQREDDGLHSHVTAREIDMEKIFTCTELMRHPWKRRPMESTLDRGEET